MPPSKDSKTEAGIPKPDPPQATALLNRVPWKLPIAVSAEGIYIDLQDGRRIIDAVGGAAVSSIGSGHPAVKQALIDQIEKFSCKCAINIHDVANTKVAADVYSMQLTNGPAEELGQFLVDTSNGAFALCGILSGGRFRLLFCVRFLTVFQAPKL